MAVLKTRGFAHRIDIAAQPARVWTVLSSPALLPLWMGADAKIKPQKGGSMSATVAPGLQRDAVIDVFDPPRRLRLIYLTPPQLPVFDGAVVDDVLLDIEDGSTVVRMLCSGVPDLPEWTPHFARLRQSSERMLARLKNLCEQRERMAQSAQETP
ncbi:MAG: SRPBCC domain-containing protein [Steroidobacteraceae bacterium]